MAFTNFYIDQGTGASDLNAGTTSANASGSSAAAFTYAGGTFVRATGVFTVASGNPASDGVTTGTYASVYTTAGAVAATFVAQITARDATTITVDVTTLKWGVATSVSETAAATTLKVSGAWTSEIVLAATGLGTFTVATSTKINIKAATYTHAASRNVSMVGTATATLWLSGYNTTPGDLDNDTTNSLTKPVFSVGTTTFTMSGASQTWTGMDVTGTRNGNTAAITGSGSRLDRCRFSNTGSGSNGGAASFGATNIAASYCYFKAASTATGVGVITATSNGCTWTGCVFDGGGLAAADYSTTLCVFAECVFINSPIGVLASSGTARIFNCTFSAMTTDGVKWSSTPGNGSCVIACLFVGSMTNGINNALGTNVSQISRSCNDYYSVTNPEVGFGDSPAFFGQTDSSSPITSSTNMTPVAGANALANGFPGIFENQSYSSFVNIGAVQQVASAGGAVFIFGG